MHIFLLIEGKTETERDAKGLCVVQLHGTTEAEMEKLVTLLRGSC